MEQYPGPSFDLMSVATEWVGVPVCAAEHRSQDRGYPGRVV